MTGSRSHSLEKAEAGLEPRAWWFISPPPPPFLSPCSPFPACGELSLCVGLGLGKPAHL